MLLKKAIYSVIALALSYLCFAIYKYVARPQLLVNKSIQSDKRQAKLLDFKPKFNEENEIFFVGNSLTEGFDVSVFNRKEVKNFGIGGEFTKGVLLRVGEFAKLRPAKVFLEIGINDILAHIPLDETMKNYEQIIQKVRSQSPSTQIYVQSILPTCFEDGFFANNEQANRKVMKMNSRLEELCRQYSVHYVNLYEKVEKNGQLNATLTYDGIHLNEAGYHIWYQEVKNFVN